MDVTAGDGRESSGKDHKVIALGGRRAHNGVMSLTLERELTTFRQALPRLLADAGNVGKFALVHAEIVAGVFPNFDAALAAGYDRFGLAAFLVREITDHEEPRYFSRNLRCPS